MIGRRGAVRVGRAVAWALFLAACGGDVPDAVSDAGPPAFDASLGVNLASMSRSETGLYTLQVAPGEGAPAASGDSVTVDYTGRLPNGETFDAGRFALVLGAGRAVPGFEEGLTGMSLGGRRTLVIPPELAYGDRSVGPVPANSWLVFDVELVELVDR